MPRFTSVLAAIVLVAAFSLHLPAAEIASETPKPPATLKYLPAKAYHILPETQNQESGYSSLCEGLDGKMYVGTAKYGENAYLVEFDPKTEKQRIVIDTNAVCGLKPEGWNAAQSKIHTRNFVAPSGRIYVGSMGAPEGVAKKLRRTQRHRDNPGADIVDNSVYPGGYVMRYDPKTGKAENLGRPTDIMPLWGDNRGHIGYGIMDVAVDEKRNLLYVVMDYWDTRPKHWVLGKMGVNGVTYREIGPMLTMFASTIIDYRGWANAVTAEGELAQYNPDTGKVTVRPIEVDGKRLARMPGSEYGALGHYPTWDLADDGKTAYLVQFEDSRLLEIDLASPEKIVPAKSHGRMIEGKNYDTRSALTIEPDGRVYAVIRIDNETGFGAKHLHHVIRFDPKTKQMTDLGIPVLKNPGFAFDSPTPPDGVHLTIKGTKDKPLYHGYHTLPDGAMTPLYHHHSLIIARDGTIYMTILYPFSLLKIEPSAYPR